MTDKDHRGHRRLQFADPGEAADLAAFLTRLLHYDRAAAVRLQTSGTALAVFGRPPSFEVLAVRTARLGTRHEQGAGAALDTTVSAGDLLESIDDRAATAGVPAAVTGPPWAGLLPPRSGWRARPGLPGPEALRGMVAEVVAEFRARTESLGDGRTRAELDRIGRELWTRPVGDTDLPVRAVHAAQSLGFLRPPPTVPTPPHAPGAPEGANTPGGPEAPNTPDVPGVSDARPAHVPVGLFAAGSWLRLSTPYGAVAIRRPGGTAGGGGTLGMLDVTPVRHPGR